MKIQIIYEDDHAGVSVAVAQAMAILADDDFYNAIKAHSSFHLSTASPSELYQILKSIEITFTIVLFDPNIFTAIKYRKTLAYTDGNYPNTLFLNDKKLNRSSESIAATIIHELIHAVDDQEQNFTFGHGNNSAIGKENTAPYWIGNLAFRMLTGSAQFTSLAFDIVETDVVATA